MVGNDDSWTLARGQSAGVRAAHAVAACQHRSRGLHFERHSPRSLRRINLGTQGFCFGIPFPGPSGQTPMTGIRVWHTVCRSDSSYNFILGLQENIT